MLEKIQIQGFRKFTDYTIDGFGQINFILGDNNVGKTTILESIYAWACGQNTVPFINIPLARARYSGIQQPYWIMEELLATVNNRKTIPLTMAFDGIDDGRSVRFEHAIYPSELLGEYDSSYKNITNLISIRNNGTNSGDMQTIPAGISGLFQIQKTTIARWDVRYGDSVITTDLTLPLSQVTDIKPYKLAKFIDVLAHTAVAENVQIYASLKRENALSEVTEEIKSVYPEIDGFDMIPYPDGSQAPVSIVKKDSIIPLYACGDGIQRWYFILGALALYKQSIICIDEIDTGFHHEAQAQFSVNLVKSAIKNGVQLFMTTHNLEFIDSFLSSVMDHSEINANTIRIITLRNTPEGLKARTVQADEAYKGRNTYNLELR